MKHTKDLHVVYIITQLELGGAQKVCLSLLEGLEQKHAHTFLITSAQGTLVSAVQDKPNIFLLPELQRNVSVNSLLNEWRSFFALKRALKKLKQQYPDIIVHTHSTKAGILGRWAAFAAGIKTRVHTIHGYAFHDHQSWLTWLVIYAAELITSLITTHFICVSSHDAKTGMRLFPRFSSKHTIIRAAVDQKQFFRPAERAPKFPTSGEQFIFGTVSCFKPQKNLFDLLQAFKHVYEKNHLARLEIIGDGILRPAIEAWITENQLDAVITLHGWQENVAPFMSTWHTFVLTSLWEGLPCAVIEARLLKLPVISYETGGIPDVITHGNNGLLYPKRDWRNLAQGMLTIANHEELYTQLQKFPDVLEDFENTQMIQEHIHLYQRMR